MAERLARCIFTRPRSLFADEEPTQTVHWLQRPETGLLSGLLFLDGSAKYVGLGGFTREGWNIVSFDRLGNLLSAAHGPVPMSVAPQQTRKDGEDYA
eukprot:2669361-Pyramimonas_sp.AAC.1